MISVDTAKTIIREQATLLSPQRLPLQDAAGHVLAADVYATLDIPAYEQSSMDGYALAFRDREEPLTIIGEMPAGTTVQLTIDRGQATRIFTGGPLPIGADTVVMQEKIRREGQQLIILDEDLQQGSNVRRRGAEVSNGALAMQQGCFLSPAAIGFLAGIGLTEVLVYPFPSVSIIITGNELTEPGQPLTFGQVYQSNSFMLTAALQQLGVRHINQLHAADDPEALRAVLNTALAQSDLVLLTGGVSVGDYDFVVQVAGSCGVTQQFHRVRQKPGKPLYFGTSGQRLVFGLPGNPSSVLSCFYQYVAPAIAQMAGQPQRVYTSTATLAADYRKSAGLTHFLKGHLDGGKAWPLGAQESFRLSSFAQANCLIQVEEEATHVTAGTEVTVYHLPF